MAESLHIELAPPGVCAVDFVDTLDIKNSPIHCNRRVFFSACPVIAIRDNDGIISYGQGNQTECPVHIPEG